MKVYKGRPGFIKKFSRNAIECDRTKVNDEQGGESLTISIGTSSVFSGLEPYLWDEHNRGQRTI
jgi:hypothetical protein